MFMSEKHYYTNEPVCSICDTNFVRDLLNRVEVMEKFNITKEHDPSGGYGQEIIKGQNEPNYMIWKRQKFSFTKKDTGLVTTGNFAGFFVNGSLFLLRPVSKNGGQFDPSKTLSHLEKAQIDFPGRDNVVTALKKPGDMCAALVLVALLQSYGCPVDENRFLGNVKNAGLRMGQTKI